MIRDGDGFTTTIMDQIVPAVVQTSSVAELAQLQSDAILEHGRKLGRPLSILEAGCGQCWLIDLQDLEYKLTGIDLDSAALELRKTKTRDLDIAICGDLCAAELPEASFDVVYSSFVLEHVPRADVALQNFVKWLRPGGLLIMRLPDPRSARGFLARVLPYGAHVWFYRRIYGFKHAGTPGHAPYPTFYHPVIDREQLCTFIAARGMKCLGCYGDGFRREGSNWALRTMIRTVVKFTSVISFGRLTPDHIDVLYIAVKNATPASINRD
jgi:SAM-dependent methyltransferase